MQVNIDQLDAIRELSKKIGVTQREIVRRFLTIGMEALDGPTDEGDWRALFRDRFGEYSGRQADTVAGRGDQ